MRGEILVPEPLTQDDHNRRSRLAASLIAAANSNYDLEVTQGPSDTRQQPPAEPIYQAPAPTSDAIAPVKKEPAARECRGYKRALCIGRATDETPLVNQQPRQLQPPRSRPPPMPHVKSRRPPPLLQSAVCSRALVRALYMAPEVPKLGGRQTKLPLPPADVELDDAAINMNSPHWWSVPTSCGS